ncbi:MAG: hypothetical protein J6386_19940 [Candidatus Synoicihabitans palmerolidicus]|nr:hypothetical protein [Candidatus Synoicihabitans palmerolidicus]
MNTFTFRTTLWFAGLVTATLIVVLTVGGWLLNRQMLKGIELLHEVEVEELAELLGPDATLSAEQIRDCVAHDGDSDAELFLSRYTKWAVRCGFCQRIWATTFYRNCRASIRIKRRWCPGRAWCEFRVVGWEIGIFRLRVDWRRISGY